VDGQPTGAHFQLRVYDDVVTLESVNTPEQVAKTTDCLGAVGQPGRARRTASGARLACRHALQLHGHLPGHHRPQGAEGAHVPGHRQRPADGVPVLLSEEAWTAKKLTQGPATIGCQMLQNPAAGNEAMFKKEWLSFIDIRPGHAERLHHGRPGAQQEAR
jgi:hypothetical protein